LEFCSTPVAHAPGSPRKRRASAHIQAKKGGMAEFIWIDWNELAEQLWPTCEPS
jgi:hypothetical protein